MHSHKHGIDLEHMPELEAMPTTLTFQAVAPTIMLLGQAIYHAAMKGNKPAPSPAAAFQDAVGVLYRLLLVRCADARDLLPESAASIRALFSTAHKTQPLLASLPPIPETLTDEVLAHALEQLPSLDYATVNGRALGELHETLLAHQFEHVGTDESSTLTLVAAHARRAQGSYYTPDVIVRYIVRHTVGPALDRRLAGLRRQRHAGERVDSAALFDFVVLDPAMGTGYFLQAAADFITARYLELLADWPDHPMHADPAGIRRTVVERCLYGVDLDPQAVALARMSLWLAAGDPQVDSDALAAHFVQGNAVLGTVDKLLPPQHPGFDAVIGNPPYVPWHAIGDYRAALENGEYRGCVYAFRPNHADAQPNLYLFFMLLMVDVLRPGGRGCYILPHEWLDDPRATTFSAAVVSRSRRAALLLFDPSIFLFERDSQRTSTTSLLFGVEKDHPAHASGQLDTFTIAPTDRAEALAALDALDLWNLAQTGVSGTYRRLADAAAHNQRWQPLITAEHYLLRYLFGPDVLRTGDRAWCTIGGGFQPPMALVDWFTLDATAYLRLPENERMYVFPALVHARSITRYHIHSENRYWIVLNPLASETEAAHTAPHLWRILSQHRATLETHLGADWWRFPNVRNLDTFSLRVPKLLTPRTAMHNSFALDKEGHVFKGTNAFLHIEPPLAPAYVLALLNSRLLDVYHGHMGKTYHGTSRKYEPGKIADFPIQPIRFTTPPEQRARLLHDAQHLYATDQHAALLVMAREQHAAARGEDALHDLIAWLADIMQDLTSQQHTNTPRLLARTDHLLDQLVYALYGLDDRTIAQVEALAR